MDKVVEARCAVPVIRSTLQLGDLCVCPSVHIYDINTPLNNCMVDFEYGIFHIWIVRPYLFMVVWWVMFCDVIPHILTSWFPVYKEKLF